MQSILKKISLILALLIIGSVLLELSAQTLEIDSLENLLHQHQKKDTIRVNLLNETAYKLCKIDLDKTLKYAEEACELADKIDFAKGKAESLLQIAEYHYYKSDYPQALEYYQKSLKINEEIGDKKGISNCLHNIGNIHLKLGNYPQSLEYYQKSLKIREELRDKKGISFSLNNIGIIHYYQGNYPQALEYYQKALKINEEIGNKQGISKCLNNIGIIYRKQSNYHQALEYYQKSLKITEEIGNKQGISICLNNIGIIYWKQGNYHQALKYYQKSLKITEEIGNQKGISLCLNNIGVIYNEQSNYPHALEYYRKSLKIRKEFGYKNGVCTSYKNLGEVYLKTNNYTKALDYTIKSLKIAYELELLDNLKDIHKQLSEIYAATKNYKKAYENYVLYKELNDSIFNEENIKKITGLEYQYEYEKEKLAIELEQQKKDAVYAEEAKRQKTVRNSFIAGFILMALLVLVVLRSFLQKRKANRILGAQKIEIEEKNTELLHKNEEIRTQAEELKTTNEELYELNVTKDKLFSVIAHDLKNPFSSIIGFVGLLIESYDDYNPIEIKEMLHTIQNSSNNAFKLLENLLDWSNSQIDGIKFDPKRISLNKLVENNFKLLDNTAKSKDIKLINQTSDNIKIYADENMLNAVIRNLLSNALKFTGKGGKVNISASRKKSYVEVIIADNGIGISKEDISKLFRIDVSFSTIGTAQEKGTGLGLILCKEFVEKHDGKIWVESRVGNLPAGKAGGSEFKFTIPLV